MDSSSESWDTTTTSGPGGRVQDSKRRVEWLGEEIRTGCVERSFLLSRLPGPVPGVLWSPRAKTPEATGVETVTARLTEEWR